MAPHRPTFRDHDCEPVNVASLPIPRPSAQHAALQTDKVQLRNMRIQASALQDAEAQTDGAEPTEEIEKMFVSSQEENANDKAGAGGAGGKKGGASRGGKWLISRDPRFDPILDAEFSRRGGAEDAGGMERERGEFRGGGGLSELRTDMGLRGRGSGGANCANVQHASGGGGTGVTADERDDGSPHAGCGSFTFGFGLAVSSGARGAGLRVELHRERVRTLVG